MNPETSTIEAAAPSAASLPSMRRRRRLAGLVLVAALGVAACESQPSSRRIANDIIKTLSDEGPVRECMLDKLDGYTDDDLDEITASASQPGPGTAIDLFEADLASCR
ncbi:MAG: hypothetical protein HKN44_01315 [Ilumatobacter sp.]|nr:hypothetical protein [Ilumatobacter sp.]